MANERSEVVPVNQSDGRAEHRLTNQEMRRKNICEIKDDAGE